VTACKDIGYVLDKLNWIRAEHIWPNGRRCLWSDAFGVVLLVSLYAKLVAGVLRRCSAARAVRIGEAPDREEKISTVLEDVSWQKRLPNYP